MKRIQYRGLMMVLLIISSFSLSAQSCDPATCASKSTSHTSSKMTTTKVAAAEMEREEVAKTSEFTFPAGKVIEVALFSIKEGQEQVIMGDYFPKVFPVAMEYGLTTSQTFGVYKNKYGGAPAKLFGFFVWDSYEQKAEFENDTRFLELRNIRNKAFDYLYQGYFEVENDVTHVFDDQSVYDFAAMWVDVNNEDKLPKYFNKVGPIAKGQEFGYEPIVTLNPLSSTCVHGNYTPNFIGFAKWNVADGFEKLQNNATYKKYVHLRDEAIPYKDVLFAKAIIN